MTNRLIAVIAIAIGLSIASISAQTTASAGEGFFDKIGDGWKQGKWIPGIPDVKPQTLQEVIFPVCWGHPQDCRDEADKNSKKGPEVPPGVNRRGVPTPIGELNY
jgi:hypothetical protein